LTDLGLRYNLLTACTSFVAVDSEARNAGGTPAMVKQPLPLPQGVSDSAVGGAVMKSYLPMTAAAVREAMPSGDRALAGQKGARDAARDREASVTVADVAVTKNLSEADVRQVLNEQVPKLETCLGGARGRLVVRLTVHADGTVKTVQILSGMPADGKAAQCVVNRLERLRMPCTKDGREGRATITLTA